MLETLVLVDPQPRLRGRRGRGADGDRGRRPADHRDGLAAHPRAGGGRGGPGGLPRRLRVDLQPGRRPPVRRPDRRHRRARLHAAARRRAGRVRRAGGRAGHGHDAARRHLRHHARASRRRSRRPDRSSARSASTPATWACWPTQAREQLDGLGATGTRIVVSGDLDEFAIAALAAAPVDVYGVGTSVVTGSGRADRRPGLQAGRGGRPAGGQAHRAKAGLGGRKTGLPRGTSRPAPPPRRSDHRAPISRRRRPTGCCRFR